jgi:hypothetical protein
MAGLAGLAVSGLPGCGIGGGQRQTQHKNTGENRYELFHFFILRKFQ